MADAANATISVRTVNLRRGESVVEASFRWRRLSDGGTPWVVGGVPVFLGHGLVPPVQPLLMRWDRLSASIDGLRLENDPRIGSGMSEQGPDDLISMVVAHSVLVTGSVNRRGHDP
jgi:hypothetical protein